MMVLHIKNNSTIIFYDLLFNHDLQSFPGSFFTKYLLDFPNIRRLSSPHYSYSDNSAYMADMAFVLIRIFLKVFGFWGISHFLCNGSYLIEPLTLIITVVVGSQVSAQNFCGIFIIHFFWYTVFYNKVIIEEVTDKIKNLFCVYKIFTRFLSVSAQIENFSYIFFVIFDKRKYFRSEFFCPV